MFFVIVRGLVRCSCYLIACVALVRCSWFVAPVRFSWSVLCVLGHVFVCLFAALVRVLALVIVHALWSCSRSSSLMLLLFCVMCYCSCYGSRYCACSVIVLRCSLCVIVLCPCYLVLFFVRGSCACSRSAVMCSCYCTCSCSLLLSLPLLVFFVPVVRSSFLLFYCY